MKFRFRRWSAKSESFLSTNGFTVLFLVTYIIALMLMFFWGARGEFLHTTVSILRWYISVARGFGYVLNLNCGLVILLASRLTFTFIRDTPLNLIIPFEKSFPAFHILVGYILSGAVVGHGTFHLIWIMGWQRWGGSLWGTNMCVGTGLVLTLVLLVMVISSIPTVRRNRFERFHILHNISALIFFPLLLFHGVYNGVPYTYKWIVLPLAVYGIDRLLRRAKIVHASIQLSKENSLLNGANVLRLKLPKLFEYRAGQYAEIKVPSIHKYEWHPFTIASAPFEDSMCFYIKAVGDWTEALRESFKSRVSGDISSPLDVQIRGPFGAPAQHVGGYQRVVLIAGGVGSTPFCSICKGLLQRLDQLGETENAYAEETESELVWKAQRKAMDYIGEAYEQNMQDLEYETLDNTDSVPCSLSELFAATNEIRDDQSQAPASVGNILGRFHDADALQHSNSTDMSFCRGSPCRTGKGDTSHSTESFSGTTTLQLDHFSSAPYNITTNRFERLLSSLHSIAINFSLYMLMLIRVVILACASIFDSMPALSSSQRSTLYEKFWITICDVLLGVLILAVISCTLCLELVLHRRSFLKSKGRIIDSFLLVPVSALSICLGVHALLEGNRQFFLPPVIHFGVILPLLMILLIYRFHRIIGSRLLLADSHSNSDYEDMLAIDFIWTTPFDGDDGWLREELGPRADGTNLRLQRYVTREQPNIEEGICNVHGLSTNFGRPDWEPLFKKIAERTPTNAKVGVFFCGPKGMSKAIRIAIMKVQVLTNLRGMYLGTSNKKSLARELGGIEHRDLQRLSSFGSNIRFVFREENFG